MAAKNRVIRAPSCNDTPSVPPVLAINMVDADDLWSQVKRSCWKDRVRKVASKVGVVFVERGKVDVIVLV